MQSPTMTDATTAGSSPSITPPSTPATSEGQDEYDNTPERWPTKHLTQDFHLDTLFNPVWVSGPHVFSFAPDGTIVRPETYATEPYPGYHADRAFYADSARASHSQGFARRDPKPWKTVAITEQDDAEWEEMRERARIGAVGEWGPYSPCYRSRAASLRAAQCLAREQPELVYTWPPKPHVNGQ